MGYALPYCRDVLAALQDGISAKPRYRGSGRATAKGQLPSRRGGGSLGLRLNAYLAMGMYARLTLFVLGHFCPG